MTEADVDLSDLSKGQDWREQAARNIAVWGHQSPLTLFLALVEEMGEVAQELDDWMVGEADDAVQAEAADIVRQMSTLGGSCQTFLEGNFEDGGEPKPEVERADIRDHIGIPIDDPDAVQDEIDDLAPLVWQLTWALEDADGNDEESPEWVDAADEVLDDVIQSEHTILGRYPDDINTLVVRTLKKASGCPDIDNVTEYIQTRLKSFERSESGQ